MKRLIFILLLGGVFHIVSYGQNKRLAIDSFIQALVKNQDFSGGVLVIEQNKVVYENYVGYADFSTKTLNSAENRFPIASISKLFTATAILQLKERGLLQVTDPVHKHLPDFPYPGITIRHLLSHTSGLPPYNAFFDTLRKQDPARVFFNHDFLPGLLARQRPLIYPPGDRGNYDNINYIVLALVIERLSGETYADYISRHILEPAGMTNTRLFPLPQQFNQAQIKQFVFPHVYLHAYDTLPVRSNSIPYVRAYWHSYAFIGFGDYISTTRDLWKFDQALSKQILLKKKTQEEAFTPVKLNNGKNHPDEFGLGWEMEKDTALGKMVYHSGAAMGLSSIILRNISTNQTVILYDNAHFNAHENATKLMKLLNDQSVEMPKKSAARIYGWALFTQGPAAAYQLLEHCRKDTVNYYLDEDEINTLGYDFLGNSNPYHLPEKHLYKEALETFRLNTVLFPDSWNAYDSYAEALLADGQKEAAVRMYEKSVELHPGNENGRKQLERLRQ